MNEYKKPIIAVGVLVLDKSGKNTILTLRNKEPEKDLYATPGGKVDYGESPTQTAKREVYEELGVDIDIINFIGHTNDYDKEKGHHHISLLCVAKIKDNQEPKNMEPKKHSTIEWFDLNTNSNELGWKCKRIIELYKKSLK